MGDGMSMKKLKKGTEEDDDVSSMGAISL